MCQTDMQLKVFCEVWQPAAQGWQRSHSKQTSTRVLQLMTQVVAKYLALALALGQAWSHCWKSYSQALFDVSAKKVCHTAVDV